MFRNDPAIGAVPTVGTGTVDVAWRTKCGEAVSWDGTDNEALFAFLNDDTLILVGSDLYRKELSGSLTPIPKPKARMVVVRPPAGDWSLVDVVTFASEFAIHVEVPKLTPKGAGLTDTEKEADKQAAASRPAKKAPVKKAVAKK